MNHPEKTADGGVPGLAARRIAAAILEAVIRRRRPLDEELDDKNAALAALDERDRALVRMLAATALRHLGCLRHAIGTRLTRGLPANAPAVECALLLGTVQILFLDVPDHAAVDLSVRLVRDDRHAARYANLVNAVLRAVARENAKSSLLAGLDLPALDTPLWLMQRWNTHYGAQTARAIATANAREPALDLTVKSDPAGWAVRLGGAVLPNGSVRLLARGPVQALPGFEEGEWWVQDAAAAIPAHLLGDVRGKSIADLCAAPGGKTAQLVQAGARVTAVDRSRPRLQRLADNLRRLRLSAEIVAADAAEWTGGPFDAVLLDAPCLATGTIRRHPDIAWLKDERDLSKLCALQARLLDRAATLLKPGGILVYCTCSLEAEEGERAIAGLLGRNPAMRREPLMPAGVFGCAEFITPQGDLRTLPCHWPAADSRVSGLDGFFAARLIRR